MKDQPTVRNVYVNRYCRKLILHFVQDDRQKTPVLAYYTLVYIHLLVIVNVHARGKGGGEGHKLICTG